MSGKRHSQKVEKVGKKITPGQEILSLQYDKGKENHQPQPGPSGYH